MTEWSDLRPAQTPKWSPSSAVRGSGDLGSTRDGLGVARVPVSPLEMHAVGSRRFALRANDEDARKRAWCGTLARNPIGPVPVG